VEPTDNSIARDRFGLLPDGTEVEVISLVGAGRLRLRFITFGGIIISLEAPDRDGKLADVTLGYDSLDEYRNDAHFMGAIIGRYANRIANGRFSARGREYQLAINDPPNHLHGGPNGFHRVVWECNTFSKDQEVGAELTHVARPSDDGYPGTLTVGVRYTLTPDDSLIVDYSATTDSTTPVNFTQHAYFNLAGHDQGSAMGHVLTLNAARYTAVDETKIPTGELRAVSGTPFDFTQAHAIGDRIDDADEQLRIGGGYDHNFVIDRPDSASSLVFAARLLEPISGRTLEIHTTEPGIQLYSGNGFDGVVGKQWKEYDRRCAVALETQHFPDSPNHPEFPNTMLEPGTEFRSQTVYRFLITG
jgi:aldose 1-epimerase